MTLTLLACVFFGMACLNALLWPRVTRRTSGASASILIPARDEEANLPACLTHAIATNAEEILVYDDHSADNTPRVVHAFAALDPRIRLIDPKPLPAGWAGKTFACHALAQHASARWLLFLDADAIIHPDGPARMIAEAESRELTFLSCWPGLTMRSLSERVLMPLLNFVVFTLFPAPLSERLPDPKLGIAHGACILIERAAYIRTGGHATVRAELFEDTRLAQGWRSLGERGLCLDGAEIVQVRMYRNFTGIWSGFQKNFYPAFRHHYTFAAFLALHAIVFFLPFVMGIWPAAAVVLATRLVLALRFRHSLLSVLLHPLAEAVLIALGLASFWRCAAGRGVTWKGRAYRTT